MSEYRIEWSIEVKLTILRPPRGLRSPSSRTPTELSAARSRCKNPDEPTIVDLAAVVSILGPKAIGKTSP